MIKKMIRKEIVGIGTEGPEGCSLYDANKAGVCAGKLFLTAVVTVCFVYFRTISKSGKASLISDISIHLENKCCPYHCYTSSNLISHLSFFLVQTEGASLTAVASARHRRCHHGDDGDDYEY